MFAAARDKDVASMIRALAAAVGPIVVTAFGDPRATPPEELAARVREALPAGTPADRVTVAATPAAALDAAWRLGDHIAVAGSIFLLGEVYPQLGRPDPFAGEPG